MNSMNKLMATLAAAVLVSAAPLSNLVVAPVAAQTLPPTATAETERLGRYLGQAAAAHQTGDLEGWVEALEQLHRMRPHNPDFMYQLVTGYAGIGNIRHAFDMMLRMQQQGLAYDWDDNEAVAPLRQHRLYDHLNTLMREAGEPFGAADVLHRLGADKAMPEALAHDPASGRLFVGTVRDGSIHVTDGDGWRVFASPDSVDGLKAVFDLLVDAERGHLWVATGTTSQFSGYRREDFGRTALLRLDLATGERLGHYPVESTGRPHLLGAMALDGEGRIYAADTLAPVIYALAPGAEQPEALISHPMFTSLRGIAVSGDGERIYVSDYELGLFGVETGGERRAFIPRTPDNLNLAGIDGLYWWNGSLVIIQNGVSPQRIMRLDLDETGMVVEAVAPLLAAHPDFDTPTFGTIRDNELILLAGSHWHRVDGRGNPVDGELPEIAVVSTRIDSEQTRVVGQDIMERLREQQRQRQEEP